MKNIFKKNQIIITALAIMIAVAGYLNFSKEDAVNKLSSTEEEGTYAQGEATDEIELLDLSEEDIANADIMKEELEVSDTGEAVSAEGTTTEELAATEDVTVAEETAAAGEETQVGEAVLVSNTIGSDFFASARLTREQTRAKNKEMLMEIVDNQNIAEEQKKEALNEIVKLTDIAEKESATEILLEAKGFADVVVSILDDGVDVIVNANELTEPQIAQIEDIVKRKTEIIAENIVISPVGVTKN